MFGDIVRDHIPLPFDEFSSGVVIGMMQGMDFLPGLGLSRRQQGAFDFAFDGGQDLPFSLGFEPTHHDYLYTARVRKARVLARLRHLPFKYSLRPYNRDWSGDFVPASNATTRHVGMPVYELAASSLATMEHRFGQMQLTHSAAGLATSTRMTPHSPNRASMFSLHFPKEADEYRGPDPSEGFLDGVTPEDDYHHKLDLLAMAEMLSAMEMRSLELTDLFSVMTIKDATNANPLIPQGHSTTWGLDSVIRCSRYSYC